MKATEILELEKEHDNFASWGQPNDPTPRCIIKATIEVMCMFDDLSNIVNIAANMINTRTVITIFNVIPISLL